MTSSTELPPTTVFTCQKCGGQTERQYAGWWIELGRINCARCWSGEMTLDVEATLLRRAKDEQPKP